MITQSDVLQFWLHELAPADWYSGEKRIDDLIKDRFAHTWERARAHELGLWLIDAPGVLAYLLVTDQFSRNLWRGDARSFELDSVALAAAEEAIALDFDLRIKSPERQFFYLPFMHSEQIEHQDRCIDLFAQRMPEAENNLLHARVHREIICEFGRFPYRNDVLGRDTTLAEQAFLDNGGYALMMKKLA